MRSLRGRVLAIISLLGMLFLCLPTTATAKVGAYRNVVVRGALTGAQINAWVAYPMPGRGGRQIVNVHVVDEFGRGVAGAPVRIMMRDGASTRVYGTITGSTGYGRISFPIGHVLPGYTVLVHVTSQYRGQVLQTYTRYTPYY